MKSLKTLAILCVAVLAVCSPGATARAAGHHQSGIIGRVQVEQSSLPFLWQVRVSTDTGEFVTALQTDAEGQFVVNLKPGTYRLTPFVPLWWIGLDGERLYSEFTGPPVQVAVAKKDFTMVELPLRLGWPQLPGWPPGWDLEIQP